MHDFEAFMAACYDEAEALAKAATPGPWHVDLAAIAGPRHAELVVDTTEGDVIVTGDGDMPADGNVAYIAACDPKHRLADVSLKRAILAEHCEYLRVCRCCQRVYPCATGRRLGTEFAGRDGYRDEWKPEGNCE